MKQFKNFYNNEIKIGDMLANTYSIYKIFDINDEDEYNLIYIAKEWVGGTQMWKGTVNITSSVAKAMDHYALQA
jgi:hypothetical protein